MMNYMEKEHNNFYKGSSEGPSPALMGANNLVGYNIYNTEGENFGDIKNIILNVSDGKVSYAVLGYVGFLGIGEKLYAVLWDALN